jgi:hypothetical protein
MGRLMHGSLRGQREAGKRACTISRETRALPASLPPLQPISVANRSSLQSKRWLCEVEMGEWPRLWPQVSKSSSNSLVNNQ